MNVCATSYMDLSKFDRLHSYGVYIMVIIVTVTEPQPMAKASITAVFRCYFVVVFVCVVVLCVLFFLGGGGGGGGQTPVCSYILWYL